MIDCLNITSVILADIEVETMLSLRLLADFSRLAALFAASLLVVPLAAGSAAAQDASAISHAKALSKAFRGAAEAASPAVVTIVSTFGIGNAMS